MKTGKVPENVLKRSVFRQIETENRNGIADTVSLSGTGGGDGCGNVWNGAGTGRDCAIFPFAGEGAFCCCVQEAVVLAPAGRVQAPDTGCGSTVRFPAGQEGGRWDSGTAEAFMTMADLIRKCANNLAAGGALPRWVMITLLLPEDSQEDMLKGLMAEAREQCRELSMEIVGGQSRVTAAVTAPVAVTAGYGIPFKNRRQGNGALPGQDVVLSKWIGLQGTAVLAGRNRERLLARYPAYLVEEAERFGRYLSVVEEAEIAVRNGASAMHDASEGGIFGALWEMAEGSGVGLCLDMRKLPLRQETVEVCECCNVNPYELLSGGCLVMTAQDGAGLAAALEERGIPAVVVGKVTAGRERILVNGEEIRYLNRPGRDGVYGG